MNFRCLTLISGNSGEYVYGGFSNIPSLSRYIKWIFNKESLGAVSFSSGNRKITLNDPSRYRTKMSFISGKMFGILNPLEDCRESLTYDICDGQSLSKGGGGEGGVFDFVYNIIEGSFYIREKKKKSNFSGEVRKFIIWFLQRGVLSTQNYYNGDDVVKFINANTKVEKKIKKGYDLDNYHFVFPVPIEDFKNLYTTTSMLLWILRRPKLFLDEDGKAICDEEKLMCGFIDHFCCEKTYEKPIHYYNDDIEAENDYGYDNDDNDYEYEDNVLTLFAVALYFSGLSFYYLSGQDEGEKDEAFPQRISGPASFVRNIKINDDMIRWADREKILRARKLLIVKKRNFFNNVGLNVSPSLMKKINTYFKLGEKKNGISKSHSK